MNIKKRIDKSTKVTGAVASRFMRNQRPGPSNSKGKVPVTMRALLQRINRKLKREDGEMLCTARSWTNQLGNYYAINLHGNYITAQHVDPEKWGREMGVLRPWERIA